MIQTTTVDDALDSLREKRMLTEVRPGTEEALEFARGRPGWAAQPLSAEEFDVWVLAHGCGQRGTGDAGSAWTAQDVIVLAGRRAANPDDLAEALRERGLLAAAPAASGGRAATLTFPWGVPGGQPCSPGSATRRSAPGSYGVGVPGTPAVAWLDACAHVRPARAAADRILE